MAPKKATEDKSTKEKKNNMTKEQNEKKNK